MVLEGEMSGNTVYSFFPPLFNKELSAAGEKGC